MKDKIIAHIDTKCPWRDTLYWFETVDSTNTMAKQWADDGALHGTVLIAGTQTGGRGRMGRTFSSPEGMGVYLSVILRPNCYPAALMHLTCAAAVAACKAVEAASGVRPEIKWTNDLVCGPKKLGGILTELSINSVSGLVDYAVIGIGINCRQSIADFPPELQSMATSISEIAKIPCSPAFLAAKLVETLHQMDSHLLTEKSVIMKSYRKRCMTLGQDVVLVRADEVRHGKALDLDDDGRLIVQFSNGTVTAVDSGEVSVRGMYGYL